MSKLNIALLCINGILFAINVRTAFRMATWVEQIKQTQRILEETVRKVHGHGQQKENAWLS